MPVRKDKACQRSVEAGVEVPGSRSAPKYESAWQAWLDQQFPASGGDGPD